MRKLLLKERMMKRSQALQNLMVSFVFGVMGRSGWLFLVVSAFSEVTSLDIYHQTLIVVFCGIPSLGFAC